MLRGFATWDKSQYHTMPIAAVKVQAIPQTKTSLAGDGNQNQRPLCIVPSILQAPSIASQRFRQTKIVQCEVPHPNRTYKVTLPPVSRCWKGYRRKRRAITTKTCHQVTTQLVFHSPRAISLPEPIGDVRLGLSLRSFRLRSVSNEKAREVQVSRRVL